MFFGGRVLRPCRKVVDGELVLQPSGDGRACMHAMIDKQST